MYLLDTNVISEYRKGAKANAGVIRFFDVTQNEKIFISVHLILSRIRSLMQNFEKRRDRYEAFASFEKPLVNLSFELEVPEFRPFCKEHGLPPFHFFLYHVLHALEAA